MFRSHFGGYQQVKVSKIVRKILIKGFILFDIPMDIVLTFEFCHDITIWKMTTFDTVDYIEIELVGCSELHRT